MRPIVKPLGACLAAQAMAAFTALTPPVFAVAAAPDFGIAAGGIGLFTISLFLAAMISAAGSGALVEDLGPIRVTQLCLLFCALGIALTATASPLLLALGGFVVGVGYGPMTPASSDMLARVTTPRSRPFVFSLKQTSVPVGGVLAGLAVPALVDVWGWRGAALTVSALALAFAVVLLPLRRELDGAARHGPLRIRLDLKPALRTVLADPRLRQLGLASFAFSAMQLCLGTYLVTFLAEDIGLALVQAGLVLSAAQGAGIAGRLAWGAIADRIIPARRILAVLGLVMSAAAVMTGLFGPGWPFAGLLAVAVLFGASAVGWNGIYLSEIVRVTTPERSAHATGGVLIFTFGGMMVGPAVFGAVAATAGFTTAFVAAAVVTVLPGLVLLRPEPAAGPA